MWEQFYNLEYVNQMLSDTTTYSIQRNCFRSTREKIASRAALLS